MKSSDPTDVYLPWAVKVAINDFGSSFNVSAAVILVTDSNALESIFYRPPDVPSDSLSPFTSFDLLFVFFLLILFPELDYSYGFCGVSLS